MKIKTIVVCVVVLAAFAGCGVDRELYRAERERRIAAESQVSSLRRTMVDVEERAEAKVAVAETRAIKAEKTINSLQQRLALATVHWPEIAIVVAVIICIQAILIAYFKGKASKGGQVERVAVELLREITRRGLPEPTSREMTRQREEQTDGH